MNELTAVFMDVLGRKAGQKEHAAAIVRDSLRRELDAKAEELLAPGTLFVSPRGEALQRECRTLAGKIDALPQADAGAGLCKELKKLLIRAEELHRETQTEIHKKGCVSVEKLHFFYADEQAEALLIAEELIQTELYRILALGGGAMFAACKPLHLVRHTLQDRLRYLREDILPVTASKSFRQLAKTRYWAVAHREKLRVGPLGCLPGYEITSPLKPDHWFMPGEHRLLSGRSETVMQGVGYFTNVTPETVAQAQRRACLRTELRAEQLAACRGYLDNPDRVLSEIFVGEYYAISPEAYYCAASLAEASAAVIRRKSLGQCLLCSQAAEGDSFCPRCQKRIKIG